MAAMTNHKVAYSDQSRSWRPSEVRRETSRTYAVEYKGMVEVHHSLAHLQIQCSSHSIICSKTNHTAWCSIIQSIGSIVQWIVNRVTSVIVLVILH